MNNRYITEEEEKRLERVFGLRHGALDIFKLIVAEWESDPTSVQCFDLRIVKRARRINAELKKLDALNY